MALPKPAEVAERQPATGRFLVVHRGHIFLALLAGFFFTLIALRFLVAPLDRFDEGLILTKADLAAAGWVPYRDFWNTYGPLDTYLLAAAFKLLGPSALVERAMGIVLACGFAAVAYRLMTCLRHRGGVRLLMTGLLGLVPVSVAAFNSAFLVNLIGIAAVGVFFYSVEHPGRRWPALAGALTALASFTRPEYAAALSVGLLAGYLVLILRDGRPCGAQLLAYIGSAAAAGVAVWTPTLVAAGAGPVINDLFVYAVRFYPRGRSIPLGQGDDRLAVMVFALGFASVWLWGLRHIVKRRSDPQELARVIALLLAAILIFTWVTTRADGAHALNAWPLTAVLLALLLQRRTVSAPIRPRSDVVVTIAGCLAFALALTGLVYRDFSRPSGPAISLARAPIVGQRSWMPADQLEQLIARIDREVPVDRPIFVGLRRNDSVLFNDTTVYFLSARQPGTVYFEFLPGFSNSDAVERTVACQLERSDTALAVLGPNSAGEPWNASSKPGSPYLDQWLAAHAVRVEEIAGYALVRLNKTATISRGC